MQTRIRRKSLRIFRLLIPSVLFYRGKCAGLGRGDLRVAISGNSDPDSWQLAA
jgi:hypothetical protein